MIVTEFYATRKDGVNLYKTYSDANRYIRKVGTEEIYSEAIDVENSGYTYEETDKEMLEDIVINEADWREATLEEKQEWERIQEDENKI